MEHVAPTLTSSLSFFSSFHGSFSLRTLSGPCISFLFLSPHCCSFLSSQHSLPYLLHSTLSQLLFDAPSLFTVSQSLLSLCASIKYINVYICKPHNLYNSRYGRITLLHMCYGPEPIVKIFLITLTKFKLILNILKINKLMNYN